MESTSLKRELKIVDAAAFSIGLVGPVGAMALLGVGAAGILGRGATLAFLFALFVVSLVAYGFIKMSQYIAHSGSVYALVGITLGPRAGFVAGWALAGAYLTIGAGSTIEIGLFFTNFLNRIGLTAKPGWIIVAVIALAIVAALGFARIHILTRTLLVIELIGVVVVGLLSLLILFKVGTHNAPNGQTFSFDFLKLPAGANFSVIAAGAVYGFLAFAGFEGAATLGEETENPKREIGRAIIFAISIIAVFYMLAIVAQSLGFGTSASGVKLFQGSSAPYSDLASSYVGNWLAATLALVASISLLAIAIGTMNAGARILFALARDAGSKSVIARVSASGEPSGALWVMLGSALVIMVGQNFAGTGVLNATFYWLTIGTIALLVAYALATLGALRFLFMSGEDRAPKWQLIIPSAGVLFIFYVIYKNAVGVAEPYNRFPFIVAAWLVIALGYVAFKPGLAARVQSNLSEISTTKGK